MAGAHLPSRTHGSTRTVAAYVPKGDSCTSLSSRQSMELFAVISGAWAVGTPFRAGERVCCSPVTPNIIGEPALLR